MITTTAAVSDALDDEQPPAPSTSLLDDSNPDSLSLSLQEWNTFYTEFVQSTTYRLAHLTAAPFDRDIVDANDNLDPSPFFLSELNGLRNELNQLIHLSSKYPPRNSDNKNALANDNSDNNDHNNNKRGKLKRKNTNCDNNDHDINENTNAASNKADRHINEWDKKNIDL